MNFNNICSIITFILSIITIIVTIKIPKKTMWFQLYTSFLAEYRSHTYAQIVKKHNRFLC